MPSDEKGAMLSDLDSELDAYNNALNLKEMMQEVVEISNGLLALLAEHGFDPSFVALVANRLLVSSFTEKFRPPIDQSKLIDQSDLVAMEEIIRCISETAVSLNMRKKIVVEAMAEVVDHMVFSERALETLDSPQFEVVIKGTENAAPTD